ncbi:MAG: hypothetical protein WB869_06785 [Candidatus Acidiferrales bacterium]|jgi:hypothetical protein
MADESKPFRGFRNPLLYTSILMVVVLIYVGMTFLSRRQQNRELEQQAKAKQRQEDSQTVESLGGNRFEILNFYAMPGRIHRGDEAQLCYGVSNAKTVTMDPPLEGVWPSLNRCINISPKKDTTYTFTAHDAAGNTKTASLTLEVR